MKTILRFLLLFAFAALASYSAHTAEKKADHPPSAPIGLTANSGGDTTVHLAWEPSPSAESYRIFRSTTQNDTGARQIATDVTATSLEVKMLRNDTTYYFKVKAVGPNGVSEFSREASAVTKTTKLALRNGVYTLAPKNAPGLRLQSGSNGAVTVATATASTAQQWTLTNLNPTLYRVSPVGDATQALSADVARARIAAYRDELAQQWTLTAGNHGFRLTPASAAEQALAATGATDGATVNQMNADGSSAQVWNIMPVSESAPDPGAAYVPAGRKLVFSDEFDGNKIDLEKWETLATFSQPHLNDEIECYQPEGVIVEDGLCVLRAEEMPTPCGEKYTWRSGAITSRSTRTFGYYEARIKLPQGQGLWPAFWLTSSKRWPPEWDIVEIPFVTGTLFQYMHPLKGAKQTWVEGVAGSDSVYSIGEGMPNPYTGYVIYGCESTPDGIKLWVNGKLTAQWDISSDTTDPMWVSLNLAVGGKWPGAPDVTTPRPANMYIDYVRVYQ